MELITVLYLLFMGAFVEKLVFDDAQNNSKRCQVEKYEKKTNTYFMTCQPLKDELVNIQKEK